VCAGGRQDTANGAMYGNLGGPQAQAPGAGPISGGLTDRPSRRIPFLPAHSDALGQAHGVSRIRNTNIVRSEATGSHNGDQRLDPTPFITVSLDNQEVSIIHSVLSFYIHDPDHQVCVICGVTWV
jgi:hypothetical protein